MFGLYGIVISNCQKILGSTNIGYFFFTLINIILGLIAFANTFRIMRDLKVPILFRIICLLIYGIIPAFIGHIIINVKDTIYSLSIVLLISALIKMIHNEEKAFWNKKSEWILYVFASILVILTRNNGIHLSVILSLAILIKLIKSKKIDIKKITIIVIPIMISEIIIKTITIYYGVIPGRKSEMYSLFMQQSARYVYFYENEVTEYEREVLSKTFAYYGVKARYDPILSDRIKETFGNISVDYIKVYIVQFMKHPNIYIDATLNMIYRMFTIDYIYPKYETTFASEYDKTKFEEPQIESLEEYRTKLYDYYKIYEDLPIVNLLCGFGVYNCLSVITLTFLIRDKRKKEIYIYIPIIVTIIILILSPIVYFRYCLPIVFATPILLAHYLSKKDNLANSFNIERKDL